MSNYMRAMNEDFGDDTERFDISQEVTEAYIDPDDAPKMLVDGLNTLRNEIFNATKYKGKVEGWAEKYYRTVPGMLDMVSRLTKIIGRNK